MSIDKKPENEEIFSTINLTEELNREREREGKYKIKPINPMSGSNRNYSEHEKSFNNTFDFFAKLAKKEKAEKKEGEDEKDD
ncbi:MAG: hypothetical protein Q4D99_00170 [Bacillota bacterium]|nr:hypothetical protein [Bacillota bacterium]